METFCILVVIAAVAVGAVLAFRKRSRSTDKVDAYLGKPLEELLADPDWARPIRVAGFDPARAELVRLIPGGAAVASRTERFAELGSMLMTPVAILIVQGDRLGLVVVDGRAVRVLARSVWDASLMLSRFEALQVVFAQDASIDGWTFVSLKVDTPQGRELGTQLRRWIQG